MSDKNKQAAADSKKGADKKEERKETEIEEVPEEEEVPLMGEDEFYPDGYIDKPLEDNPISKRNQQFFGCYGIQSKKRFNLHFLEDDVIIFATGNTYQIYNIATKQKQIFYGQDLDGIGSISVHPSKKYFAVGEKGKQPNIFIYEYPSMRLYRILRKGTECIYAHIEFSNTGTKLASVGGAPDYTITVWDWMAQKVVLKAKAFSQEVIRTSFSPFTDDILFTSGSGHIRFWRMAQTFTGLKLQGEIGKFGQLEISDVTGFAELPDGKVLSGTDYGTLILWEGNLVKAHLVLDQQSKKPLHNGPIELVFLEEDYFISCGGDGFIKWWRFMDIETAEGDEVAEVQIAPMKEKQILDASNNDEPAFIVNMVKGNGIWLLGDAKGKIWKLNSDSLTYEEVTHFHSDGVNDLVVNSKNKSAVTIGQDGQVKLWDYIRDREVYSRRFIGAGTCADYLAYSEANQGKVLAVGFDNGIVRILSMGNENFDILKSFKAHDSSVVRVKYSPDMTMLVTASKQGEIFFFNISGQEYLQKYDPMCMIKLPEEAVINDLKWDTNSKNVLVACQNGRVYEVRRPKNNEVDNTETFLVDNIPIREWKIKMMEFQMKKNQKKDEEEEEKKRRMRLRGELPKEETEVEEDWDPEPILACQYLNDGSDRFIVSSMGQFSGYIYICDFNQARPQKAIEVPKSILCKYLDQSPSGDFLVLGFDNGEFQMRCLENSDRFTQFKMHDAQKGKITAVKFDESEKFVLSTAEDGLMYVHQIDRDNMRKEALFDPTAEIENIDYIPSEELKQLIASKWAEFRGNNHQFINEVDRENEGIDPEQLTVSLKLTEDVNEDVIDPSQYSIQQAKLRTEEDHRMQLAEEKKEGVKEKIKKLRKAFKELSERNNKTEEWVQLTEDDFNIDPVFFEMLQERNNKKIDEAKKEVAWSIEFHTLKLNKLWNKFYDVLEFEKFTVKAIKTVSYVTTFRIHKMSEFLQRNIETFKQMLESDLQGMNGSGDFGDEDLDNIDASGLNQTKEESKKDAGQTKTSLPGQKAKQQQAGISQQKKTEAEKKREERKLQREARKKKIEKLEKKEAMHSGEDPEDRKEIEIALSTYGDYKLKMSADYIVPENQRVNFSKKRQQMVLLEGSIHKLKVDFNKKIQELKIRKKEIIDRVKKQNSRLSEINTELGEIAELFEPSIDEAVEYPEKYFDIHDDDIESFKRQKQLEKDRAAAASKKGMMGGAKKAAVVVQDDAGQQAQAPVLTEKQKQAEQKAASDKAQEEKKKLQGVERKIKKEAESELDKEMKMIRRIELQFEREQITKEIADLIVAFDDEIKEMQKEKYRLESDLKNAEMKLILYFEELILLRSMEGKDQELTKRLAKCRQDKGQILREINEISKKLRDKKKEIDEIKEKEDNLMGRFHELCVDDGSENYEKIRKFFEKIIKRRRRVERHNDKEAGEGGDDEDEAEEEEEQFEEEEEEDEDENNVVGLPQEEFKIDEIEKLRDERMDLHEEKEKILSFINDLENQRKRLENQEKKIKAELEDTEEEIQDFQKEKMAKLNQLDVSVVLKVKQMQHLEPDNGQLEKWAQRRQKELEERQAKMQGNEGDGDMTEEQRMTMMDEEDYRGFFLPKDLKDSVLFTRTQLLSLINRKKELDEEQINLDKAFKEYKRDSNQKKKEIKENEKKRAEKEREYNERQMLRFGNLVDLDNLEISGPSNAVLELQNKFSKTEKKCIKLIEDADGELEKTQRDLTQAIKNNTNLLNLIRQLGEEQLDLNRKLDSTNKAIFVDEDDEDKKIMMEDKQRLKNLLELQAKEIESLKTEINLYKRKGGHIYTKVTTNRRVANLNQNE